MNKILVIMLGISFSALTHSMYHVGRLVWAIDTKNIQEAQQALNDGADVNFTYGKTKNTTPLHFAIRSCYYPMVELLLAKGANINAQDANGLTPLHWAVRIGDAQLVTLLLDTGADINAQAGEYTITPLHWAILENRKEMVQLLLEKGANSRLRYGRGNLTAFQLAQIQELGMQSHDIVDIITEHDSLKMASAKSLAKLIKNGELSLESLQEKVPFELYELIWNCINNSINS